MVKLYKIKFLKDSEVGGKGEIVETNKKSAESYINNGYAEYVNGTKKKIKLKKKAAAKKKIKQIDDKETQKDILLKEKQQQELENYKENEINWLDDDFYDSWDKIKGHCKNLWGHKEEYIGEPPKWFFLAHSKDVIKGKPQLVENVKKTITLVRLAVKDEERIAQLPNGKKKREMIEVQSFYFFDERFDKRHDGFQVEAFSQDFFIYRVIDEFKNQYFILSKEEILNQACSFKGMLIELDDFAEMNRNLKLKSVSKLFILKEYEPDIKILSREQIIKYTKEKNITGEDWIDFLAYHKWGSYNLFPEEVELLRSAFVLSGKVDDYPLHLGILGPTGTRKTCGHIETLSYKFSEKPLIMEGANSRIKGLSPSFKEKPANIGYLAKANRMGWIDEIGKMVEAEISKHQINVTNVLGELNSLLEHKDRQVGSGNDNEVEIKACAKFIFVTNPVSNKNTIYQHVGLIDPTTMSRMLWWVQDKQEQDFVLKNGVVRIPKELPPTPPQAPQLTKDRRGLIENRKKSIVLKKCWGEYSKVSSRDEFLCLFDSCYSFVCDVNDVKVEKLADVVTMLAKEPMKSSVWKPRAYHHVKLLIDGLCKHRCLFEDYDINFTANQTDYERAERILIRMVKGWDTILTPKEEFRA